MNTLQKLAAAVFTLGTLATLPAQAQVYIGARFGRGYWRHCQPPVVYAAPPPVAYMAPPACGPMYAPAPVYMAPPPVVVAPPPYGYYRHGHRHHRRGW